MTVLPQPDSVSQIQISTIFAFITSFYLENTCFYCNHHWISSFEFKFFIINFSLFHLLWNPEMFATFLKFNFKFTSNGEKFLSPACTCSGASFYLFLSDGIPVGTKVGKENRHVEGEKDIGERGWEDSERNNENTPLTICYIVLCNRRETKRHTADIKSKKYPPNQILSCVCSLVVVFLSSLSFFVIKVLQGFLLRLFNRCGFCYFFCFLWKDGGKEEIYSLVV